MVMYKIKYSYSALVLSLFCIAMASAPMIYAEGFYTIIGPDGRPMVVPKKDEKQISDRERKQAQAKPTKTVTQTRPVVEHPMQQQVSPVISNLERKSNTAKAIVTDVSKTDQVISAPAPVMVTPLQEPITTVPQPVLNSIPPHVPVTSSTPFTSGIEQTEQQQENIADQSEMKPSQHIAAQSSSISHVKMPEQLNTVPVQPTLTSASDRSSKLDEFSQVDGVEYVNNEYLEEQEFNLEGKKRFYSMPDGLGRVETVERKKGVGRSILDKVMKRPQQPIAPIALSEHYVRLSAQDLSVTFENERCFIEQYPKSKSIKSLKLNKDLGLWPTKPLKESFEYELVKLDPDIQYLQIDSYSSSSEKPTYYWPLVIFLDDHGCIQEGVSGFKNQQIAATFFQHTALQGVLKVPSKSRYMMMTPLASAVDVPEQQLSDQGQIKISVLQ